MSRTAARAAAATAIATTLMVAAPASASPPPKSLTNQFPLGTQTLSHTATTSPSSSSAAAKQSSPAPKQSATAPAPTHAATAPAAPTSRHDGPKDWILIVLVSSVIVAVLVDRLVLSRSRRGSRRRRRGRRADAPTGTGNLTRTAELTRRTPDPFEPPASERAKRTRPLRDDRTGGSREEREPPPLIIRRRPD